MTLLKIKPNTVHVWVIKLNHQTKQSPKTRQGISGQLLQNTLKRYIFCPKDCLIPLAQNPYGRPFIPDSVNASFDFNLSHSHERMLIAIVPKPFCVGIDLEHLRPLKQPDALAKKILSKREYNAWQAAPRAQQNAALLKSWIRKESLTKALGLPAPRFFTQWDTFFPPKQTDWTTCANEIQACNKQGDWQMLDFNLDNYSAALVTNQNPSTILWHKTTEKQLD
jgi:phosphopantetheine--protein transferase-like protein